MIAPRDNRDSTDQDDVASAANRGRKAADLGLRSAPYGSLKPGLSLPGTREAGARAWLSLNETESHDWVCYESRRGRRQTAPALTAAARESGFQQFRGHLATRLGTVWQGLPRKRDSGAGGAQATVCCLG